MSVVVEVSARKIIIPQQCACCGAPGQMKFAAAYIRSLEQADSLTFPDCEVCERHSRRWALASSLANVSCALAIVAAIAVAAGGRSESGAVVCIVVGVVLAVVLWFELRGEARAMCKPGCASPSAAVQHLDASGTARGYLFHSAGYAASFAGANAEKLVNITPELWSLLQASAASRYPGIEAAPRGHWPLAAPPMRVDPAPARGSAVLDWIARIESYRGAEARRNALAKALEEITDPRERLQLQLAASRIETASVLEKVDSLATAPAKKRHLERAIAALRSDEIPDELQAEQLRELEARLRELG